jgi:hypothetical protein
MAKIAAYDADGIWGAGDNEDQARAEAAGYLHDLFEDPLDDVVERTVAGLRFAPISDELLEEVHAAGRGFEFFALTNGTLVSSDEAFATTRAAAELLDEVSA